MFSAFPDPAARAIHPLPDDAPAPRRARPRALPLLVMGVAVPAIFCTVALPAYAYRSGDALGEGTAAFEAYKTAEAQSVDAVRADAIAGPPSRDGYGTTSAAEIRREALAAQYRAYGGPTVRDLLANPPYPGYDPNAIVSIAMQYLGAPYVYGGSTPAGFDCSGFTQFVFAHVGVSLPHSSSAQGRLTAIAPEAAIAGDLVVMDGGGHVGIYLGNGTFIHASTPATGVKISQPWGNYWFVRPGV